MKEVKLNRKLLDSDGILVPYPSSMDTPKKLIDNFYINAIEPNLTKTVYKAFVNKTSSLCFGTQLKS